MKNIPVDATQMSAPRMQKVIIPWKNQSSEEGKTPCEREFSLSHKQIDHMKTVYWWDILGNIHFKNDLQLSMRANHI